MTRMGGPHSAVVLGYPSLLIPPIRERGEHVMHGSTETILNAEISKSASICVFISVHIPATFGNNIVLFLLEIIISS